MAKSKKVDPKVYMKNAAIRAGRTFVQAFIAVLMANQAGMFEADVIMAALVAGASAVVSVVQNALEDAPFAFMSKIEKQNTELNFFRRKKFVHTSPPLLTSLHPISTRLYWPA